MKRFLPHLNLAMAICMLVITYVDNRNPMMGFLKSTVGFVYLLAFGLITLINCIVCIRGAQKKGKSQYLGKHERKKAE